MVLNSHHEVIVTIPTVHAHEPAFSIINRLGGKGEVSYRLDLDKSTLSRWCQPRPQGTGGMIPQRHWPAIIALAREIGVPLTLEDLAGISVEQV